MRSNPVVPDQNAFIPQYNNLRADARGASSLLAQQLLGYFSLGTTPTNGQTLTLTINGNAVVLTAVGSIGTAAGNVLNPGTAAGFTSNVTALLNQPQTTNANAVALSLANQTFLSYLSFVAVGTTIYVLSNNITLYSPLSTLTGSTTVTSGTYTANTLALYVHKGTVYVNGTRVLFSGGITPTVTAPSTNPRIDVLSIDSTGTLAWTAGTENASPTAPAYPDTKAVICELYNVVGETKLLDNENQSSGQGYIYNDVRPFLQTVFSPLAFGSAFIPDGDETHDLGAASFRWNNLYANLLHGDGSNLTNVPIANITAPFTASEALGSKIAACVRPLQSDGGVEFDTGGTGTASGTNGTVNNISVTIGANSNRLLIVTAFTSNSTGGITVTHNGNAPSATLQSNLGSSAAAGTWTFIWFNPTTGTHNIAVTIASSAGLTYGIAYLSLYNVNQTSQPSQISNPGGGNPATAASITTATAGSVVVMVAGSGGTLTATNPINPQSSSGAYIAWSDVVINTGTTFTISKTSAGANGAWEFQPAASVTGYGAGIASSLYPTYRNTFVGFTTTSAALGAAVTLSIAGVVTGFTGLMPGVGYYLNDTPGTFGTTPGTNVRKLGIALSTTTMLITTNF